jgi:hypothetical protein
MLLEAVELKPVVNVTALMMCLLLYNLGEGIRTVVRIRQLNTPPLTNATFFRTGV